MNKFPHRRLLAATALAAVLTVLALPAAAAPLGSWTAGPTQMSKWVSWFDSIWTGLFGVPAQVDPVAGPSGPTSIHDQANQAIEPDGVTRYSVSVPAGPETSFTEGSW